MATTPIYLLPYQGLADPPHGPNLGKNLAEAVEAQLVLINTGLTPLVSGVGSMKIAYKAADSPPRASTTTVADDPNLVLALPANGAWRFDMFLLATGVSAASIKFNWSGPTGYGGHWTVQRWQPSAGATAATPDSFAKNFNGGTDTGLSTVSADTNPPNTYIFTGWLTTAGTAGNLTFRWAQNVSNASGTVVKAGSHIVLLKVA